MAKLSQEKIEKDAYFWNMIASLVNACEAIVMLMVVTRTVGLEDAGILTISFTIANLMMCIGKFGMRNFQITDVNRVYDFKIYKKSRIISMGLMTIIFALYLTCGALFNGYSLYKILILTGVFCLYAAEVYEDVYWAEYQKNGRLDIGAKNFVIRWIGSIMIFCIGLIILENTVLAVWIAVLIDWILMILLISLSYEKVLGHEKNINGDSNKNSNTRSLIIRCLPLVMSSSFAYYVTNSSKYAIDGLMSEEIQASYGFVSMPIFAIGLVNMIIYQPILVFLTNAWKKGDLRTISKKIKKQIIILLVVSACGVMIAWHIGIPALELLYVADLAEFKFELIVLLIGGMWLALAGFFATILTMMRKLNVQMLTYGVVALLAAIFTRGAVKQFGTRGAAVVNMLWTFLLAIIFGCKVFLEIMQVNQKK